MVRSPGNILRYIFDIKNKREDQALRVFGDAALREAMLAAATFARMQTAKVSLWHQGDSPRPSEDPSSL
jgi:hypothetical protein